MSSLGITLKKGSGWTGWVNQNVVSHSCRSFCKILSLNAGLPLQSINCTELQKFLFVSFSDDTVRWMFYHYFSGEKNCAESSENVKKVFPLLLSQHVFIPMMPILSHATDDYLFHTRCPLICLPAVDNCLQRIIIATLPLQSPGLRTWWWCWATYRSCSPVETHEAPSTLSVFVLREDLKLPHTLWPCVTLHCLQGRREQILETDLLQWWRPVTVPHRNSVSSMEWTIFSWDD